jgi:hypothetical protein
MYFLKIFLEKFPKNHCILLIEKWYVFYCFKIVSFNKLFFKSVFFFVYKKRKDFPNTLSNNLLIASIMAYAF